MIYYLSISSLISTLGFSHGFRSFYFQQSVSCIGKQHLNLDIGPVVKMKFIPGPGARDVLQFNIDPLLSRDANMFYLLEKYLRPHKLFAKKLEYMYAGSNISLLIIA